MSKLILGTRRKWPRPRQDADNFSRDETETDVGTSRDRLVRLETETSRPRRRDQDHHPESEDG